jgi:hypothetical protein
LGCKSGFNKILHLNHLHFCRNFQFGGKWNLAFVKLLQTGANLLCKPMTEIDSQKGQNTSNFHRLPAAKGKDLIRIATEGINSVYRVDMGSLFYRLFSESPTDFFEGDLATREEEPTLVVGVLVVRALPLVPRNEPTLLLPTSHLLDLGPREES